MKHLFLIRAMKKACVHPTGSGSSVRRTNVTELLQSLLFIYNPNLEQCASWRLLIYKQNIGMSLPEACFSLKCNTCHTFSEAYDFEKIYIFLISALIQKLWVENNKPNSSVLHKKKRLPSIRLRVQALNCLSSNPSFKTYQFHCGQVP